MTFILKHLTPEKGRGAFTSNIGNKLIDFVTFVFALPALNSVSTVISIIANMVGLFWGAINNQSFGMIPWLIFAFVTVFWGGNWPTFWIMVPYKDIYMAANGASSSFDTFKTYFKAIYLLVVIMYILNMGTCYLGIYGRWFWKENYKRT